MNNVNAISAMAPLLLAGLIIWAGVFFFMLSVDRKIASVERRLDEIQKDRDR